MATIISSALFAACTPSAPPASSPTPSASSAAPTETEFQRQERVAYEGAEAAYREFVAEYSHAISTANPRVTPEMRKVAGGPYLKDYAGFMRERTRRQVRTVGRSRVEYVKRVAYAPGRVQLTVCEDGTASRLVDKKGRRVGRGIASTLNLTVQLRGTSWKVWEGDDQQVVKSCAA